MTTTKQTVCIASDELKKEGYHVPVGFIGKYGYFFTPEELERKLNQDRNILVILFKINGK